MHAADIYTCKDASGKQLVSDRPISSCIDREQKVLSNSAVVKKVVPPSYTAQEAAAIEARKKNKPSKKLLKRKHANAALSYWHNATPTAPHTKKHATRQRKKYSRASKQAMHACRPLLLNAKP